MLCAFSLFNRERYELEARFWLITRTIANQMNGVRRHIRFANRWPVYMFKT